MYSKRLFELVVVAFGSGAGEYVLANGFEFTKAGLQGLAVAGLVAAYGVFAKQVGDKTKPTVVK